MRFASFGDWLRCVERIEPNAFGRTCQSSDEKIPKGWYGSDSFAHALKLARFGWPAGLAAFNAAQSELKLKPKKGIGRVWESSHVGAFPIVPEFIAGDPEHMRSARQEEVSFRKGINLIAQTAVASSVKTEEMLVYGLAVCRLIDELENAGVSVSCTLTMHDTLVPPLESASVVIPLKGEGEIGVPNSLLFALAHPSNFRRLFLRLYESFPVSDEEAKVSLNVGYGRRPYDLERAAVPLAFITKRGWLGANPLFLPPADRDESISAVLNRFRAALPESFAFVWEDS